MCESHTETGNFSSKDIKCKQFIENPRSEREFWFLESKLAFKSLKKSYFHIDSFLKCCLASGDRRRVISKCHHLDSFYVVYQWNSSKDTSFLQSLEFQMSKFKFDCNSVSESGNLNKNTFWNNKILFYFTWICIKK